MTGRRKSRVVFNLYSLTIGRLVDIQRAPQRPKYGSDLGIIEVVHGDGFKRVRWRLTNCRDFTPQAFLARQAFLILARTLKVPLRRLERPRKQLWQHGFNRHRQRVYADRIRRRCRRRLLLRWLSPRMTCTQVIAIVLKAPVLPGRR